MPPHRGAGQAPQVRHDEFVYLIAGLIIPRFLRRGSRIVPSPPGGRGLHSEGVTKGQHPKIPSPLAVGGGHSIWCASKKRPLDSDVKNC